MGLWNLFYIIDVMLIIAFIYIGLEVGILGYVKTQQSKKQFLRSLTKKQWTYLTLLLVGMLLVSVLSEIGARVLVIRLTDIMDTHVQSNYTVCIAMMGQIIFGGALVIGLLRICGNNLTNSGRTKVSIYSWVYVLFPISQFLMQFFLANREAYRFFFGAFIGLVTIIVGYIADAVFLYVILHVRAKQEIEKEMQQMIYLRENELLQKKQMQEHQSYTMELEQSFQTKTANILQMINLGQTNQAQVLYEQLCREVASTKETTFCNSLIINAVLAQKLAQCEAAHIVCEVDINLDESIGNNEKDSKDRKKIWASHLCSIYSNLLDNAIRATSDYDGEKIIHIKTVRAGDYIHIMVDNTCKKPKYKMIPGHGYGQQILREIADHYNGRMISKWKDQHYTVNMMLKIGAII